MIVHTPPQPTPFEASMKLVGEFDSRIDELELYDSEEVLLSITSQKDQHSELSDLIKEFVKYQHRLENLKRGL